MINCKDDIELGSSKKELIVGVGEMAVSGNPNTIIKTYGLGSCVAVIVMDKINSIVGMVHIALPDSKIDRGISERRPGYFANTGIPALIDLMIANGSIQNTGGMVVKLAGGAQTMDSDNIFEIGKRNIAAINRVLWMNNMRPVSTDLGGNLSRTVSVCVASGMVKIFDSSGKYWDL